MPFMNTTYETDRLSLRICTKYDARLVLDFYKKNMEDFMKYEVIDPDVCRTLRFHENVLDAETSMCSKGKMMRFYFFEKSNPLKIVGTFAFHDIQYMHHQCARVGYKVGVNYRRKGYAKEALKKGLEIVFNELDIHRIEAFVLPDNAASIGLLESLGFIREGLALDKYRINGAWRDHYQYARINSGQ